MSSYSITPIPAFQDNYFWLIHNTRHAWVVDPGEALPVLEYLSRHKLTLAGILLTHHHADHIGGVADLRQCFHDIAIVGCPIDALPPLTQTVHEGDHVTLHPLGLTVRVMDVPGHTRGHVAYLLDQHLFCGDTLFAGGCGRLFEGTPEQMWQSLSKLNSLPDSTLIYCAHEYTLSNLTFALNVEPNNADLSRRLDHVRRIRARGEVTLPSSLAEEQRTNPFLRVTQPAIKSRLEQRVGHSLPDDPAQLFAALRTWKNQC